MTFLCTSFLGSLFYCSSLFSFGGVVLGEEKYKDNFPAFLSHFSHGLCSPTVCLLLHHMCSSFCWFHLRPENPLPVPDDQKIILFPWSKRMETVIHSCITLKLIMVICSTSYAQLKHAVKMAASRTRARTAFSTILSKNKTSVRACHHALRYVPHSVNSWRYWTSLTDFKQLESVCTGSYRVDQVAPISSWPWSNWASKKVMFLRYDVCPFRKAIGFGSAQQKRIKSDIHDLF